MYTYEFQEDFAQEIVSGILQGYKEYLYVRKEKKTELEISTAYAWVKGNHIEDAVSQRVPDFGVTYHHSKAGYAWGYLQFNQEDEKILFIIKNGMKHGSKLPSTKKKSIETNYLAKLAEINKNADFNKGNKESGYSEQLSFDDFPLDDKDLEQEVNDLATQHDRFFIVSYSTDENKMISDIELLMPNPYEKILYKIEDWTQYIELSDIHIESEEVEVVKNEKEPQQPNQSVYEYDIEDLSEEKREDK